MYIVKRTQIYLDEEQDRLLDEHARLRGVTKSEVIRQAVDAFLEQQDEEAKRLADFHEVLEELRRNPLDLPAPEEFLREMRAADRARQEELERRWHG